MALELIVFAVEAGTEEEPAKGLFYLAGALLAGWAVLVAAVGIARHDAFPAATGTRSAIMAVTVVLVLGVMASTVLTS